MRLRPAHSLFVLLVVLELFLVGRVRADHPPGTLYQVSGYIRDQYSNAVVGILVYGDNFIGDTYPSITDSNGHYLVSYPSDGNYRLTVDCASLTAHGYGCIGDVGVAQEGEMIFHHFVVPKLDVSLQITNATLPHGNVGLAYQVQLGATGGQPPYHWELATNSPSLPAGLSLHPGGIISGTPTAFSAVNLIFDVTDDNEGHSSKTLQLIINPRPRLSLPSLVNNRFTMRLSGAPKQNYTLQYSTNLFATNWISLLVTNNPDLGTFSVRDTNAIDQQRFYRVLIGP
jgi:hypothetical protein